MVRESPVEANDRHTALPGLRWPGGRHVAVVLNVAYEVWSQGQVSGVGPMGNPLPAGIFDTNADSYGRYGATDGIRRLMRKLEVGQFEITPIVQPRSLFRLRRQRL